MSDSRVVFADRDNGWCNGRPGNLLIKRDRIQRLTAGGDSGSLLCDMNGFAVGLLFAGSSTVTIHNHIMYVQNLLNIRVA